MMKAVVGYVTFSPVDVRGEDFTVGRRRWRSMKSIAERGWRAS